MPATTVVGAMNATPPIRVPGSELRSKPYAWFLAAVGSWFGAWGVQIVMFQWLVVEVLGETPVRVGSAQMAVLLPSLAFVLVGGAVADRVDRRRWLAVLHLSAAFACAALAATLAAGALTYGVLIAYALGVGTLRSRS